jgi:hypothetical protein
VIELRYREKPDMSVITYHLAIDEEERGPFVAEEWLRWTRGGGAGRPFKFLDFQKGEGQVADGEMPDESTERVN